MEDPEIAQESFEALVEGSLEGLRIQTEAHRASWQFGEEEEWTLNQEDGELLFLFPDTIARAPVQIIGTFNVNTSTWLWAWANESIAEPLTRDARRAEAYGREHGFSLLARATWQGEESDGWRMAALVNRLCGTNGVYRGPAGAVLVFMTFGEVRLERAGA